MIAFPLRRTFQCFYQSLGKPCQGLSCPFLLSHEKIGLLKHLAVCWLFSMVIFCLIWPTCCSARALLPHLALTGKIFWKSELYKLSTCCHLTILVCWLKSLLLLIAHHPENNFKNPKKKLHENFAVFDNPCISAIKSVRLHRVFLGNCPSWR